MLSCKLLGQGIRVRIREHSYHILDTANDDLHIKAFYVILTCSLVGAGALYQLVLLLLVLERIKV